MITHLVFDGVADGPMGVALDIVGAAARVVQAGLVALPKGRLAPRQRIVSVDGEPVCTAARRTLAVDGAFGLRGLGPSVDHKKRQGRGFRGHITVRHRGGGVKRKLRIIDWKRNKFGVPGKVERLEYDPMRNAHIALIFYVDGKNVT